MLKLVNLLISNIYAYSVYWIICVLFLRPGVVYTFQALSEEDCELWLDAMDGKEPMYVHPPKPGNAHHTYLDEAGFTFVAKCFQTLESRGKYEIAWRHWGNWTFEEPMCRVDVLSFWCHF